MKITALEVDGYGVWSGLKLDHVSDGLNVFHGPNEAGKTTLMQFVRSVLYGFTPPRRRYLPPVNGGRPGGSVEVAGPNGHFQISRHENEDDPGGIGQLALVASDGTMQGEHLLKVLLCNIDEPIFQNVFAIGLQELQELGTLSDTEAASLLYSLSAGLDRIVLVDVMRELENSRNRLLDAQGQPSRVARLYAQREKLRDELAGFADLYLLDFKYGNNECAEELSQAPGYWEACTRNHLEAARHGELIVRVLVLPGHNHCCTRPILEWIARNLGPGTRVNLMFQYRPEWRAPQHPTLKRRLTAQEIAEAREMAREAGLINLVR